jgi:hypothetical protein
LLNVVAARDVGADRQHPVAGRFAQRRAETVRWLDVDQHAARAFGEIPPGYRLANTACCTREDGHFPLQSRCHACLHFVSSSAHSERTPVARTIALLVIE